MYCMCQLEAQIKAQRAELKLLIFCLIADEEAGIKLDWDRLGVARPSRVLV